MIDSGLPYPTYDEKASSSSSSSSSGGDTLKLISPELELVEKPRTYRDNEDRFELSPPGLNIPLMALNDELILNDAKLSLLQHQLDLSEYYQDDYSSSLSSYIQPPQMLPNTHQSVLTSSKSNSSLSTYLDYGCSPSLEHSSSLQVSNNSASKARRAIFRNLNNDASISAANSFVDSHSTAAATATTAATVRNPLLANPFLFSRVSNSTSTPSNMKVAYGGFAAAATANTSAAAALAQTQANLMSLNRFKLADDDDEQIQEMASYKLERQVTSTNRLPTPFPRRNPLQLSNIEDNQAAFMRQSNLSKVEETNLSFRQQQFVYPYNNSYTKPNTKGGVNRSSGGVPAPLVQPPVVAMNPFSGPSLLGDPPQAVAAAMALSRQMSPSYHYSPYLRAPLHHQSQSFGQSPAFNNRSSNNTKGPRQSLSQSSYQATGVRAPRAPHAQANTPCRKKEQIVLHVTNLDYKISANEWIRILTGILEKSCKEPITLTVESKEDKNKPLVGVLHLSRKEDARTAISLLHHKKIGYKRLNVNVVSPNTSASPRSKIVALLKSESSKNEPISNNNNINMSNSEMPLSKFMELFEARYSHTISIAELFKQRDLVQIVERGQGGRSIRLLAKNYPVRLDSAGEMYALLNSPYCSLHCSSASLASLTSFTPNVIVSLRGFKIAVHKLLNDHGGHMSLLSFVECYRQCICDDSLSNIGSKMTGGSAFEAHLYHLLIDNENGVPLEHVLTCVKDVQIEHNEEKHCKYLRWEADKSKPQTAATNMDESSIYNDLIDAYNQTYESDNDEEDDDEPHRLSQFAREVVELLKGVSRSILLVAKFNDEFHKKYGRQFRVADYGHTNLMGLLEAIPHIVQIIDGEFEKRITLTHRVQVRRFSNDLLKVLKGHPSRQMFADELPAQFERQLGRSLDIRDYGVCYVEDMLAELPESAAVSRKELNGRTFLLVQRFEQTDDERLCTRRLELEIVDLLKHKPRFLVRFNKLIPTYHHHFGRQCRLGNYGFLKLIDLIDAMPHCVHIFTRDLVQFVQLRPEIQIDLISSNIVNIIEENGCMLRISMQRLEDVYISKYDRICYRDFGCETFYELIKMLPLANKFVDLTILPPNNLAKIFDFANMSNREHNGEKETGSFEVLLKVSSVNKHMLMQISRILLKKMLEDEEGRQSIRAKLNEARASNRCLLFGEIWAILNGMFGMSELNERSKSIVLGSLSEYFNFVGTTSQYHNQLRMDSIVIDFSNLFHFAKQLVGIFKAKGRDDLMLEELESNCLYLDCFLNAQQPNQKRMKRFPAQMFGYIDTYLLFTQGLSLMLVVKKFGEKRMCFLRREFWSQTFANTVSVSKSGFNLSNYANQTDVSKLPRAIQARANFLRN